MATVRLKVGVPCYLFSSAKAWGELQALQEDRDLCAELVRESGGVNKRPCPPNVVPVSPHMKCCLVIKKFIERCPTRYTKCALQCLGCNPNPFRLVFQSISVFRVVVLGGWCVSVH